MNLPTQIRFFRKVEKTDGCWIWKGANCKRGYGRFYYPQSGHYLVLAHRFSYEFHKGKIPEEMDVCHSCDNPSCVNPDHLWIGTHGENMRDGFSKGRIKNTNPAKGERHHRATLTWEKVREIRSSSLPKYGRNSILSKKYNVSVQIIERILNGRTWIE